MKCPKCQQDNRETAKFCNECGQKLEIICAACNNVNPPGSKFCDGCGCNITLPSPEPAIKGISFDDKFDKIQRYLPKGPVQH